MKARPPKCLHESMVYPIVCHHATDWSHQNGVCACSNVCLCHLHPRSVRIRDSRCTSCRISIVLQKGHCLIIRTKICNDQSTAKKRGCKADSENLDNGEQGRHWLQRVTVLVRNGWIHGYELRYVLIEAIRTVARAVNDSIIAVIARHQIFDPRKEFGQHGRLVFRRGSAQELSSCFFVVEFRSIRE